MVVLEMRTGASENASRFYIYLPPSPLPCPRLPSTNSP